jgi:hypothetical protein
MMEIRATDGWWYGYTSTPEITSSIDLMKLQDAGYSKIDIWVHLGVSPGNATSERYYRNGWSKFWGVSKTRVTGENGNVGVLLEMKTGGQYQNIFKIASKSSEAGPYLTLTGGEQAKDWNAPPNQDGSSRASNSAPGSYGKLSYTVPELVEMCGQYMTFKLGLNSGTNGGISYFNIRIAQIIIEVDRSTS